MFELDPRQQKALLEKEWPSQITRQQEQLDILEEVMKYRIMNFEVLVVSPPEYNNLVAEIYCDGLFVATISQEFDDGIFQIETPSNNLVESEIARKVNLQDFLDAVKSACDRLKEMKPKN